MALKPMTFIGISFILLIIPGVLFNNSSNSFLVHGQNGVSSYTATCPGNGDVTCQGSVNVGCSVSSGSQCTLSGTTVSVLNQNSPFTQLLSGNIVGFFNDLITANNVPAPFDTLGLPTNAQFPVNCYAHFVANQSASGLGKYPFTACTQSNTLGVNITAKSQGSLLVPFRGNITGVGSQQNFFNLKVANKTSYGQGQDQYYLCLWEFTILWTIVQGGTYANSGYNYMGCQFYHTYNSVTTYWSFLIAMNTNITLSGANQHFIGIAEPISFQSFNAETAYLTNANQGVGTSHTHPLGIPPASPNYLAVRTQAQNSATTTGAKNGGTTGIVLAFLGGIFLLLLGLGLNFTISGQFLATGGGVAAGVNQQGTRLAQVVGLFLIGWTPLYSEFSTWFTSGLLPNGLDGFTGIISLLLTSMGFFGMFWAIISWGD